MSIEEVKTKNKNLQVMVIFSQVKKHHWKYNSICNIIY